MRFIIPLILIAVAITVFFVFVTPIYSDLSTLRREVKAYDEALGNSKALENERDKLTAKYNSLNKDDLQKLEKMMPENVDNIRLILEIEELAAPYGMALRDVKYQSAADKGNEIGGAARAVSQGGRDYGVLELEFTTSGKYADFTSFLRDLENNLRIVDISEISFSSGLSGTPQPATAVPASSDNYEYTVQIKTYWLKN